MCPERGRGGRCSAVGQAVTCTTAGPLAAGASSNPITLTVSVAVAAVPSVTNTAAVATPGEIATGNNSASDATTVINPPNLAIAKSHTGNFTVGVNGAYTITVSNAAGSGPTTGTITVTDTLPTGPDVCVRDRGGMELQRGRPSGNLHDGIAAGGRRERQPDHLDRRCGGRGRAERDEYGGGSHTG